MDGQMLKAQEAERLTPVRRSPYWCNWVPLQDMDLSAGALYKIMSLTCCALDGSSLTSIKEQSMRSGSSGSATAGVRVMSCYDHLIEDMV